MYQVLHAGKGIHLKHPDLSCSCRGGGGDARSGGSMLAGGRAGSDAARRCRRDRACMLKTVTCGGSTWDATDRAES
jgi:hypothetical protein